MSRIAPPLLFYSLPVGSPMFLCLAQRPKAAFQSDRRIDIHQMKSTHCLTNNGKIVIIDSLTSVYPETRGFVISKRPPVKRVALLSG